MVTSPEHFQAKHALGLDPRVDTGSPSENAIKQRESEHFQANHALGLDPRVDTGSPQDKCDQRV
jgi:hypothetical protein